jgi:hypothetical protein
VLRRKQLANSNWQLAKPRVWGAGLSSVASRRRGRLRSTRKWTHRQECLCHKSQVLIAAVKGRWISRFESRLIRIKSRKT